MTDPYIYEARYGWNRRSLTVIVVCMAFCAIAVLVPMPLWLRITVLAFFGGGAVMFAVISSTRRLGLRVDSAGVTLCTSPLYQRKTTRQFPWEDIRQVVTWRVGAPWNPLDYVGVERRPDAPPLTGAFTGRRAQAAARLTMPAIPAEVAVTAAAANGWKLDKGSLVRAVTRFAPAVSVFDATTGRRLTPPQP